MIAPPERADQPVKKLPMVQPMPTVHPIPINAPPIKPFIISPIGGILKPNSRDIKALMNAPITVIIPSTLKKCTPGVFKFDMVVIPIAVIYFMVRKSKD